MPSKIFSLDGKTRMETDMAKMKSGNMNPNAPNR